MYLCLSVFVDRNFHVEFHNAFISIIYVCYFVDRMVFIASVAELIKRFITATFSIIFCIFIIENTDF